MYPVFHLLIQQILIECQPSASSGEESGNELRKGTVGGAGERASGHLGWAAGGRVRRQGQGQAPSLSPVQPQLADAGAVATAGSGVAKLRHSYVTENQEGRETEEGGAGGPPSQTELGQRPVSCQQLVTPRNVPPWLMGWDELFLTCKKSWETVPESPRSHRRREMKRGRHPRASPARPPAVTSSCVISCHFPGPTSACPWASL